MSVCIRMYVYVDKYFIDPEGNLGMCVCICMYV